MTTSHVNNGFDLAHDPVNGIGLVSGRHHLSGGDVFCGFMKFNANTGAMMKRIRIKALNDAGSGLNHFIAERVDYVFDDMVFCSVEKGASNTINFHQLLAFQASANAAGATWYPGD